MLPRPTNQLRQTKTLRGKTTKPREAQPFTRPTNQPRERTLLRGSSVAKKLRADDEFHHETRARDFKSTASVMLDTTFLGKY
jgi:hypothetical protein